MLLYIFNHIHICILGMMIVIWLAVEVWRRPGEVDKIEIAYSRREEVRDGYG